MPHDRKKRVALVLLVLVVLALAANAFTVVPVMEAQDPLGSSRVKPKITREQFAASARLDHKAPITLQQANADGGQLNLPKYLKYHEDKLTPIRDQGKCSACWSIATTAMLADRISIYTNGAIKEELSSQEMISCWDGHQGKGCSVGGVPELAYSYLINQGVTLEKDFPYVQQFTNKIPKCDKAKKAGRRVFAQAGSSVSLCIDPYQYKEGSEDYNSTIRANVESMKCELFLHSIIIGTMMVYEGAYDYNGLSVYTGPKKGEKFVGGHCLEISGFCEEGVNKDEPGFEGGFWICKQSWGTGFPPNTPAASGYMYIKMGNNCVGIESRASACLPVITPEISAKMADSLDESRFLSYEQYRNSAGKKNFVKKATKLGVAYKQLTQNQWPIT